MVWFELMMIAVDVAMPFWRSNPVRWFELARIAVHVAFFLWLLRSGC
jgi:hypothetical protein